MISKGVFRRSWFPRAKRRFTTPSPDPPPGIPLPHDRSKTRHAAQWKFWRKRWRRPGKPKSRAVISTSIPVLPSTLNGSSFRHGLTFKRQVFRYKWYPRRSRAHVPFDPPPAVVQDPTIIQLKPLRMRRVRNAIWRKKFRPRARRRYSLPDIPLTSGTHLLLYRHPKAWFPRSRRKFTPPQNSAVQVTLARATCSWTGTGPVVNGSSILALAKAVWNWTARGILAPSVIVLTPRRWGWNASGLSVGHPKVIVTLAPVTWSWQAKGIEVSFVWTPTLPQGGVWTAKTASTGTWTLHNPNTGTWTKL